MVASIVDVAVDRDVPIDDTCGIGNHLVQHLVPSADSGDIATVAFPHRLLSAEVLTRKVTPRRCPDACLVKVDDSAGVPRPVFKRSGSRAGVRWQ